MNSSDATLPDDETTSPIPAPPEVASAPASMKVGKFVRTERLGAGGMGDVWKAWDTALGRWVALKLLKTGGATDLKRFEREARTAAALTHAGIAAVYEVDVAGDAPFIAMQLVEGETLSKARLSAREAAAALRDAARAVHFAHERGIFHRDLKPDNVMIGKAGVTVVDFGLAREVEGASGLTATGMCVGTPAFMPPEQVRAETADARSDVYGLGATLYAVLAGRPPFEGAHVYDVLAKALDREPERLEVDAELYAIVRKAMEKERAQRTATAAEFADDLARWLRGEAVKARPMGAVGRAARWVSRHRGVVAAAVAMLVVAGIVLMAVRIRTSSAESAAAVTMAQLRKTAETCLSAALDQRRAGSREGMRKWADELESACRAVMAAHPELGEPHALLGRLHRAMGRSKEALAEQEEALRLDPTLVAARYERLVVNRDLVRAGERELAAVKGKIEKRPPRDGDSRERVRQLEEDVERIMARPGDLQPGQADCARGFRLMLTDDRVGAREALVAATGAVPIPEEAYQALVDLAMDAGKLEEAAEWGRKAAESDAGNATCWNSLALTLHFLSVASATTKAEEHLRGAVAALDRVIAVTPESEHAWHTRAQMKFNLSSCVGRRGGDGAVVLRDALADADEALKRDDCYLAHLVRGSALLHLAGEMRGDRDKAHRDAVEEFGVCLTKRPDFADALRKRASAWYNWALDVHGTGRDAASYFERAQSDLEKAAALEPGTIEARELKANFLVGWAEVDQALGRDPVPRLKAAIAECDAMIDEIGRTPMALLTRSVAHYHLGDVVKDRAAAEQHLLAAINDATGVVLSDPANRKALRFRARALTLLGLKMSEWRRSATAVHEAAVAAYRQLAELPTSDAGAWTDLGGAIVNQGLEVMGAGGDPRSHFAEAIACFDKAISRDDGYAQAWLFRGNAHSNWHAWLDRRGEPARPFAEKAVESWERATRLWPAYDARTREPLRILREFLRRNP